MELGSHKRFLERIRKSFYYGNLPVTERLSLPATELAADLYSEVKARHSVERLRLDEASEISRNACVSPCSLVLAIIYLEQLKATNLSYLDKVSPSDLFIVSLIIATKFLNDSGEEDDVLNSEWAASVGLTLSEINRLEREFLAAIDWKVFVKEKSFWERLATLEKDIALKEGNKRGWFSYTDLEKLIDAINAVALAQTLFTVSAVCLASYTAALLTIVGSTLLVTQLPKYSLSSVAHPADVLNATSRTVLSPVSMDNSYDNIEDCEKTLINFINIENSIEEMKEYLEGEQNGEWNEDRELNLTRDVNQYITLVTDYIQILSNIEYLPSKIRTLSLDNPYFLHNCFS
ncbi:hypothetical protein O3M35_001302 [Rhynocoris fuscipes]|uniref:Protein CNPPD1 n=1 Tax=Rhynocoris fuscipes TaxID=488301 RepID=A0AAW1DTL1_9HEMI